MLDYKYEQKQEENMSTQTQARALMIRHQQLIKNREQCMLSRAASAAGMPETIVHYDRSHVGMS
jgi:hypothetical protein